MLIITPQLSGSEISLSARIDKTDIPFESTAELSLDIRWEGKVADYAFELLPLPTTQSLKILGTSTSVRSEVVDGRDFIVRSFHYTLEPTRAGLGLVEPIILKYISLPDSIPAQLASQRFQINIDSPLPKKVQHTRNGGFFVYAIPILIVLVTAGLVIWFRRQKSQPEPVGTSEEALLLALSLAKRETMSDRKLFFSRLYTILSQYLESKCSIKTAGRTAAEILGDCETANLSDDLKSRFNIWLTMAEKEKYAPLPGEPGDMIRLATEIENLFEKKLNLNKAEA